MKDGVHVVVVGKRPFMCKAFESEIAFGLCEILIADDSDDVIILKKAFERRCSIVSRYHNWRWFARGAPLYVQELSGSN